MTVRQTPVDRAYRRYDILSRILERTRQQALADPTHSRNLELGLTDRGRKKHEVEKDIEEIFEELTNLVNHLGILDMAASVEHYSRARLSTAIGEARRVIGKHYSIDPLRADREKLVHDLEDIQGLARIASLVEGQVSVETSAAWEQIRDDRNKFAHGTDILVPPATSTDQARDILNEMIKWL